MLPQLLLTVFFFLWPAGEAVWSSMTREDPFGLGSIFVGLDNFADLFADPLYIGIDHPHRGVLCGGQRCCR